MIIAARAGGNMRRLRPRSSSSWRPQWRSRSCGNAACRSTPMYQHFFGFHELPFELTPNPKYLFLTARHREGLSALEYGLSSAKAITVLIGEAGTGKTTLLQAAIESDRCRGVDKVHLNNPALTRSEFVELLARRFGLSRRAEESKATLLSELEH